MLSFVFYALATALYLLGWQRLRVRSPEALGPQAGIAVDLAQAVVLLGLFAHAASLVAPAFVLGVRFGFAHALSVGFLVGAAILWLESLSVRVDAMWLILLPGAAAVVWLPALFPGAQLTTAGSGALLALHLVVGLGAYSVLLLAALHALLMAFAERALHGVPGGSQSRWLDRLPPLLVLERLLFRMITLGFALLTLTVLTGVVFAEETFGRPMRPDHKSVLSILAWILFGVLLLGRHLRGWRGRTALRFTLSGFGLLLLAYVGTRFVLEVVLQRFGA
ncbi:MAG: cytochrome c biogenesis protein CcsA [Burkholderiales bacterium]|nr:MAG: cytochrome c biogenesis protein CcsA [Burkholderiales bacterium]